NVSIAIALSCAGGIPAPRTATFRGRVCGIDGSGEAGCAAETFRRPLPPAFRRCSHETSSPHIPPRGMRGEGRQDFPSAGANKLLRRNKERVRERNLRKFPGGGAAAEDAGPRPGIGRGPEDGCTGGRRPQNPFVSKT